MDRAEKLEYLIEQVGADKIAFELFCNWLTVDLVNEFFDDMCDQWDIKNPTEDEEDRICTACSAEEVMRLEVREGASNQLYEVLVCDYCGHEEEV